jgi:hypothetical protein
MSGSPQLPPGNGPKQSFEGNFTGNAQDEFVPEQTFV